MYPTRLRFIAPLLILFSLLSACSDDQTASTKDTPQQIDTSASFKQFLDTSYAQDMVHYPATASQRGIHNNDRAWNPVGEASKQQRRQQIERRLASLQSFDRSQLNPAEDLSWQLYQRQLLMEISSDNFRHHKYPISQFRGPHTSVPSFLINIHRVNSVADAENYIARLHATSDYFDQTLEQMQSAAAKDIYLPDWSYPQMITTARNTISGAPYDAGPDSTIWNDIKKKIADLDIDDAQQEALRESARAALVQSVGPAYERLISEFERLGKIAPAQDGVWKMPDGDAFYAERLKYFTTTELGAEDIHAIGLREVARIHDAMRAIMTEVEFSGTLAEFFVFMREDPQFYYPGTEEGRARYLREATAIIATMRTKLPEAFGIFPDSELVVKRVEAFRERSAGKAFYQYPAADGSRPGYYYANLYDMASMPVYQMEALAYHEGIPGHHMQRAIAVELKSVPEFQKFSGFTAYSEGWGLYSEQLPKEMGFYSDPYSDFGRLAMELWRACRLVVDSGLHHKRWTREQAIDYLVQNTPNSVYDSTKAIERYNAMPGQATAYLIGKLKIIELREKARAELGDKFDIRGFHDEILKDGQVPLSILEEKIERWVKRVKAS